MFDFFNGYFEVSKELQKIADGAGYAAADRITMINGSHSLIRHMVIKSSGKIVYESDNLHRITNAKNLLEYSEDYSRSVAKNSFWYLDSDNTTANTNTGFEARRILTQAVQNNGGGGARSINETIPLNRYSFFQELERKMLPPMKAIIYIELQMLKIFWNIQKITQGVLPKIHSGILILIILQQILIQVLRHVEF